MKGMNWKWTQHFILQMKERGIAKEVVDDALLAPDNIMQGKRSRLIFQKIVAGRLLRIVTEGDLLITVYMTDKVKKYMEKN